MRCTVIIRHAAIIATLLTLQTGCKSLQKNSLHKQAKEIRKKVPDVDVVEQGNEIAVSFKPTVLFEFDKSDIPDRIKNNLDWFAAILLGYPDTHILIQGHTDDTGTESRNMSLSEQRAQAVEKYLAGKGVPSARMAIKGYGATAPKYPNDSEANRAKNRRVAFLITGK